MLNARGKLSGISESDLRSNRNEAFQLYRVPRFMSGGSRSIGTDNTSSTGQATIKGHPNDLDKATVCYSLIHCVVNLWPIFSHSARMAILRSTFRWRLIVIRTKSSRSPWRISINSILRCRCKALPIQHVSLLTDWYSSWVLYSCTVLWYSLV